MNSVSFERKLDSEFTVPFKIKTLEHIIQIQTSNEAIYLNSNTENTLNKCKTEHFMQYL